MGQELVFLGNNERPVTNSMKVAEIFGKRNSNVLRDIRELDCSKSFRELNFELCHEIKQLEVGSTTADYYQMTKDGFIFLVMGYTGAKASQFKESYINAFNDMERLLKNVSPDLSQISKKDLAKMLYESETKLEQVSEELSLEKRNKIVPVANNSVTIERMDRLERIVLQALEPLYKARTESENTKEKLKEIQKSKEKEYISQSYKARITRTFPGAILIRDMCRIFESEYHRFAPSQQVFSWFCREGWLLKSGRRYYTPSEEMIKKGLIVSLNTGKNPKGVKYATPYVTPKGVEHFAKLLIEKGGIF